MKSIEPKQNAAENNDTAAQHQQATDDIITESRKKYNTKINAENIPVELKKFRNWVNYRLVPKDKPGEFSKVPYTPKTDFKANTTNPRSWRDFETAFQASKATNFEIGCGFVLTNSPFAGVDIDGCIDENGEILRQALEIVEKFDSYTEISPSGRGLRIIFKASPTEEDFKAIEVNTGAKSDKATGLKGLEAYHRGRYLTITGNVVGEPRPIAERTDEYLKLLKYIKRMNETKTALTKDQEKPLTDINTIIERARDARNKGGEYLFKRLFDEGDLSLYNGDDSRADLALLNLLCFWTGGNRVLMEQIFRQSALATNPERQKKMNRPDYVKRTIDRALKDWDGDYWGKQNTKKSKNKIDSPYFEGKTFLHNIFGDFLKQNEHILRIENQLHIYRDGVYVSDTDELEAACIRHIPNLKNSQRAEALKYIRLTTLENTPPASPRFVAFKNGVYDIVESVLNPPSDEYVITNLIPWDYNEQAFSLGADYFLQDVACHDQEIMMLFEELIGYCFYRDNRFKKAFFLLGDGSNGKSCFLFLLQKLLGDENCCSLDLNELSQKFSNAELFGRLANIGDDISSNYIDDSAVFKKLCTGERLQIQRKGERPFDFTNRAKLLFSANTLPRIKDKTGATLKRMCIIPFNATFDKNAENFDPNLREKLNKPEVMEYFCKIGIKGLQRLIRNGGFTEPKASIKAMEAYELQNNPVKVFLKEIAEREESILGKSTDAIYFAYKNFCENSGFKAGTKTALTQDIKRFTGLSTFVGKDEDRKSVRIFTK